MPLRPMLFMEVKTQPQKEFFSQARISASNSSGTRWTSFYAMCFSILMWDCRLPMLSRYISRRRPPVLTGNSENTWLETQVKTSGKKNRPKCTYIKSLRWCRSLFVAIRLQSLFVNKCRAPYRCFSKGAACGQALNDVWEASPKNIMGELGTWNLVATWAYCKQYCYSLGNVSAYIK